MTNRLLRLNHWDIDLETGEIVDNRNPAQIAEPQERVDPLAIKLLQTLVAQHK